MPYIKQVDRILLDQKLNELINTLFNNSSNDSKDGMINYIVSRIIDRMYSPSYHQYNRAIGVLECIKQEFYRRKVAPYEDLKIQQNGDIYQVT